MAQTLSRRVKKKVLKRSASEGDTLEDDQQTKPVLPKNEIPKDEVDYGFTQLQKGFESILESEQEDETFKEWLEKMKVNNRWKDDCPVSLDQAMQLDMMKVGEIRKVGMSFNELIMERLGKDPILQYTTSKPSKSPIHLFQGCENMDAWRKRIQIACKSFHGDNRDLNAVSELMEKKSQEMKSVRGKLQKCMVDFHKTLSELETDLVEHLLDDATFYDHKTELEKDRCPIIVAGQVSSGKSSLLNLFLGPGSKTTDMGQDIFTLPVSVLTCTERICEISYGSTSNAVIKNLKTGHTEDIEIEKLTEHVNMQGQDPHVVDEARFNEIIQLCLPLPFLKDGITLVDTPGIGESQADSDVLKSYIHSQDVFGFIFTIHVSAGIGMTLKFQEMLTELSTYKDDKGNKKLDPESVVIVCNFWDQVHKEDRKETVHRLMIILKETGCMKDFNPEKQLFFMNSRGAFETWNIGFISEDYSKLIGGIEHFLETGYKSKMMHCYVWFCNFVQRVMKSVKLIQVMAKPSAKAFMEYASEELDDIKTKQEALVAGLRDHLQQPAEDITKEFLHYLGKTGKKPNFSLTKEDVIYLETFDRKPELQEFKVDEIIDSRIKCFLNAWEADENHIYRSKLNVLDVLTRDTGECDNRLDELERQTLSAERMMEVGKVAHPKASAGVHQDLAGRPLEDTITHASFGRSYGDEVKKALSLLKNEPVMGNHVIINSAKRSRMYQLKTLVPIQQVKRTLHKVQDFEMYFMHRGDMMFKDVCHKKSLKHIMLMYLEPLVQLITNVGHTIQERITLNKNLINTINQSVIEKVTNKEGRAKFFKTIDKLAVCANKLLELGYTTELEEVTFHQANLSISCDPRARITTTCGVLVPGSINKDDVVTVRQLKDHLSECEQLEVVKHLRKLSTDVKQRCTPVFLGLCDKGYGVVLKGQLVTTRHYFFSLAEKKEDVYRNLVKNFILCLADALSAVHKRDLVTGELSMDTVVLQTTPRVDTDQFVPLFTNVRETGQVRLPDTDCLTGNYIYLPGEVLHTPREDRVDSWYTSAGDVYGLGVIMLELYLKCDFLKQRKAESLNTWRAKSEPGSFIKEESRRCSKVPLDWIDMCAKCLKDEPKERPRVDIFHDEWNRTFCKHTTV